MDALTSATSASASKAAGQGATAQGGANQAVINSDFETFLKMLTAQLENQDPLNPLESQDFAVQLATFSNVEQQTKTNTLLEDLANRLGGSDLSEMSQWIGRDARISGTLPFTGEPLVMDVQTAPGAVSATLIVENMVGKQLASYPLDTTKPGSMVWDGLGLDGQAFSPGTYKFRVLNEAVEGSLPDGEVTAYIPVLEARTGPLGPSLMLEGGLEVSPEDITALRQH
jgi:flagellar basal-body rod modification protein FlgD